MFLIRSLASPAEKLEICTDTGSAEYKNLFRSASMKKWPFTTKTCWFHLVRAALFAADDTLAPPPEELA